MKLKEITQNTIQGDTEISQIGQISIFEIEKETKT